jgi:hypothetical protein
MPTVQMFPLLVQQLVQDSSIEFASGAAVSVTVLPVAKLAVQVGPQTMPVGELVTVPIPVPDFLTVNAMVGGANVA